MTSDFNLASPTPPEVKEAPCSPPAMEDGQVGEGDLKADGLVGEGRRDASAFGAPAFLTCFCLQTSHGGHGSHSRGSPDLGPNPTSAGCIRSWADPRRFSLGLLPRGQNAVCMCVLKSTSRAPRIGWGISGARELRNSFKRCILWIYDLMIP